MTSSRKHQVYTLLKDIETGEFPILFHYVNVGPEVKDHEMITDVYLPLRASQKNAGVERRSSRG